MSSQKGLLLSFLDKQIDEWEFQKKRINYLRVEIRIMDLFLSLHSFTDESSCSSNSMLDDVVHNIQALFQDAAAQFLARVKTYRWYYDMPSELLNKISNAKLEFRAKYSFPETFSSLSFHKDNIDATREFVKEFICTVASDLQSLLYCSIPGPRRQMEEVLKELEVLRKFVHFISDIFTDPQHALFTHILVVVGHSMAVAWFYLPDLDNGNQDLAASSGADVSFSDLQEMMQPIHSCIQKIYLDALQALKSEPSAWHLDIQIEFVKKFIDTVERHISDLLQNFYSFRSSLYCQANRQRKEIVKELKFLRNFVYFISDRCTDPQIQQAFFTHVLAVFSLAARVAWMTLPDQNTENQDLASIEMKVSISDLRMMIQPIQPRIRMIYIDVLESLKSEQSRWHPDIKMEYVIDCETGFVETFMHSSEELPFLGEKKEIVALKDRMAILQEMLNLLRADLINQPLKNLKFDFKDIDVPVINVGILVHSLYDSMEEKVDLATGEANTVPVLDLSGNMQSIQTAIYLIMRNIFQSKLPRIDGLRSIDIILDNLKEFQSHYSDSLACIKSQLQTIQKELQHFQKQHDGFQYFSTQVIAKANEVEHVAVACINKDMPEWLLLHWIQDIIEEIALLVKEVAENHEIKVSDLVLHNTAAVSSAHTSQFARITSMKEEMVGFKEVMDSLRQKLLGGSSKLDVISIVGMPGSGKTTVANKLYLDQSVVSRFDVRADCCVSQVYTRKDLLLAILHCVKKDMSISDKVPESELADKLRKLLFFKRYLILVDDVWETSAWDDLKHCFQDAKNGSRIILTTRNADVAFHAKIDTDPLVLRLFTPEESWMLLEDRVFNGKSCPPVLKVVGQKIAQKCGGLPLSIVLVAGILETMEKEKNCWEQVAINLGPHIQAKSEDIIELSYQDLPFHLKPCFLYFGVFLEDEAIHVSKLTWLWTAEGLVDNHQEKLLEDTAKYYLENLIGRNLVMVAKKSSDGKIKACRIHDLLLDFCRKKAKEESFLEWIKGYKGMEPSSIFLHKTPRRLSLYCQGDYIARWSLICSHVSSFRFRESRSIVSSSIDCASYAFNNFKSLALLDLEWTVIDSFPEGLTCLRYIAVRVADVITLSENLKCLETLIVKGIGGRVSLPSTLWKMVKLRHLHIYSHAMFTLDKVQELRNPSKMDDLQTLSSAWFSCVDDADNILAKTPNLRKLRCEVSKFDDMFPAFDKLTKLEMLKFSSGRNDNWYPKFNFPPSLRKLTLSNGLISSLDRVASIPSLEVLKLLGVTTYSKAWKVTDEQFPQLKFLKLQCLSFSKWNVSNDAFPCLEHLVLRRCRHLKEIPSHFEYASSLKSVKIISCNEELAKSAMVIRETLIDNLGTSGFEVFIPK